MSTRPVTALIALLLLCVSVPLTVRGAMTQTYRHYLSGKDFSDGVEWEFMCSSGRNSNKWTRISVPSCWETQGFGRYFYGWEEPAENEETGFYRYTFHAAKSWRGCNVRIVFEGSMTDTSVSINGCSAGDVNEGGFYRFSYDVTDMLNYGNENTLEVTVRKTPSNTSVYQAERQTDFWLFGGIYRPVYLEIKPENHIESLAVDARADGTLSVRPFVSTSANSVIDYRVETLDGEVLSVVRDASPGDTTRFVVEQVTPWSHETPALYMLVSELKVGGRLSHRVTEKIGFRTFEVRPGDGLYLNGKRVIFKGVNRHCFRPESGRTLSREVALMDAELIKEMNMNAVRMSHYPPDVDFLEICDSIGLLVIDELCGWQKKYDTPTARRLVKSLVERDRNHPSVVMWANGNEGGWNREVDADYDMYDLQRRFVIHPWERFNGTDTKHYPDYNYVVNSAIYDRDIFFPTEFMHGVFDGGSASSLADFWEAMMKHEAPGGGFLWALIDEGLVRQDMNDSIDCRYDLAPDGILGPHREKEGSFYAVKDIWSPVRIGGYTATGDSCFSVKVENDFTFTDLESCEFKCSVYDISMDSSGGFKQERIYGMTFSTPSIKPGERRVVDLKLPAGTMSGDMFQIDVTDPTGRHVYRYTRPLTDDVLQDDLRAMWRQSAVDVSEDSLCLYVAQAGGCFVFDKSTGRLARVELGGGALSLSGYPSVATGSNRCVELLHYRDGDSYIVKPVFDDSQWMQWVFSPDMPPRVDYSFSVNGDVDYIGVGFDYPEDKILSMQWVGNGPYRVWKNRREGVDYGVHAKSYNNTVTGESWDYPEFKGYHSDCRGVRINTTEGDFAIIPTQPGLYLQMLRPDSPRYIGNARTAPPFPDTAIGFMNAIPAIGTKFQSPAQLGPSGQKNMQLNYMPFRGSLYIVVPSNISNHEN